MVGSPPSHVRALSAEDSLGLCQFPVLPELPLIDDGPDG